MQKILILNSDDYILSSLKIFLTKKGHFVSCTKSLMRAEELLKLKNYNLLIIEKNKREREVLNVLDRIRDQHIFLKIFLMGECSSYSEKIEALKLSDVLLVKPFHLTELLVKVENILKFHKLGDQDFLENSNFLLKKNSTNDGTIFNLRPQELRVLECLIAHKNMVISYETISRYVWGYKDMLPVKKTINVYIRRIRSKIPTTDFRIVTFKNRGYKFIDLRVKNT